MINNKMDHRVQFLHSKICTHGNVPWQSQWGGVPREYHSKVHRFAKYITDKNFERWKDRDCNLTYQRLLEQATRGYMGEMYFYHLFGEGFFDVLIHERDTYFNAFMVPDWFRIPDEEWPNMKLSWSPDHTMQVPYGDNTVGIEDKTGRFFDPGWALQWSTGDRRSRVSANRMPLAYGAVGPNYFVSLMECRRDDHTNQYYYRVAALVRGIDIYNARDFQYKGVPLLGPMANGNKHKRQLTKEVLYNSRITFYRPRWVRTEQVNMPMFSKNDFPVLKKKKKVRFNLKANKVYHIEEIEDGEIVENWGDLAMDIEYRAIENWEKMMKHIVSQIKWLDIQVWEDWKESKDGWEVVKY